MTTNANITALGFVIPIFKMSTTRMPNRSIFVSGRHMVPSDNIEIVT